MLRRDNHKKDDHLDRIGREVLRALKVNQDEIDAAASSPDLYRRLHSRIKSRQTAARQQALDVSRAPAQTTPNFTLALVGARRWLSWALAAAVVLALALATSRWLTKPSPQPPEIAQPSVQQTPKTPDGVRGAPTPREHQVAREQPQRVPRRAGRHLRALPPDSYTAEVATDFLPLTYIADSAAMESGHVVRVKMPRSALVSFGLPMNVDRASELVKADVLIGDDGLARAIRFVQ